MAHNFLFVHIPKTAGNSIQNVLKAYSEDKIVCLAPHQDGLERFEVRSDKFNIHKHSTLQDYQAELGDDIFQRLFKFTTIRNPWDRMVSYYFSPHRGHVSWDREQFTKLVAQISPTSTHIFLADKDNPQPNCFNNIDFFIRYENLNDDFKKVCELIEIPWRPLPIRNQSKRQLYSIYYDDELIALVKDKFSEEIHYFNYEF